MNFYNGYSPAERAKKLAALHRLYPNHSHPYYQPPCHMCGDPTAKVQPHDEDYAEPYRWERPAIYAVCATCHARLHRRFNSPYSWLAFKMHLQRGGFGSDLRVHAVARAVARLAKRLESGEPFPLPLLRDRKPGLTGAEWWAVLSTDIACRDHPSGRPR